MLNINNLDYDSWNTIVFQRTSVVLCDLFLAIFSYLLSTQLFYGNKTQIVSLFAAIFTFPGLILIDNIHFQYNAFLFAFQILSIYFIVKENYIKSGITFAILLNLKHIYLYISPVYFIFLLKIYCFSKSFETKEVRFHFQNFVKLGISVVTVFVVCFAPFIYHLPQVLSRLFPFKRGLTHAYWAPNIWAIYNAIDVVLAKLTGIKEKSGFTSGLVDDHKHLILPQITPGITLFLSGLSAFLICWLAWNRLLFRITTDNPEAEKEASKDAGKIHEVNHSIFICFTTLIAFCSFLFGWHVHEKAILLVLVPFTILVYIVNCNPVWYDKTSSKLKSFSMLRELNLSYMVCLIAGIFSLFPLLENYFEIPIKFFTLVLYLQVFLPLLYSPIKSWYKSVCSVFVVVYISLFIPLFIYVDVWTKVFIDSKFAPLMMTSLTCSIGLIGSFLMLLKLFYSNQLIKNLITSKEKTQ